MPRTESACTNRPLTVGGDRHELVCAGGSKRHELTDRGGSMRPRGRATRRKSRAGKSSVGKSSAAEAYSSVKERRFQRRVECTKGKSGFSARGDFPSDSIERLATPLFPKRKSALTDARGALGHPAEIPLAPKAQCAQRTLQPPRTIQSRE